ncbi:MAG TPA: site-2 protease family protein [Vicinamibacteria bacterium]|nr:site-2 protease family protein [Vicinamibacteria bacterium]
MITPEIFLGITTYVVLLFSLSVHESAHGYVAYRMGDDTAMLQGRVDLNPLVHIDPVGTFLIPLLQIFWGGVPLLGWAKPTPVGAHNFRKLARGHVLVAGAGPASNLLLAVLFTLALLVIRSAGMAQGPHDVFFVIAAVGIQMNLGLALFNLVPVPPLDGSWIVSWGLPRPIGERYDRLVEPFGPWLLLLLFIPIGKILVPIQSWLTLFIFRMVY